MTRKIWPMLLALFTAVGLASMSALGAAEPMSTTGKFVRDY
jgi:hypothetical protein